jgi:hypothetical protein
LCAAAIEKVEPAAATGWSSLQANTTHTMTQQNHPTFPERTKLLKVAAEKLRALAGGTLAMTAPAIANDLLDAAETVMSEVLHMEAAQAKFAGRKTSRETTRASR